MLGLAWVDNFLNGITMYRLLLYYLIGLLGVAVVLSALGVIGYSPWSLFTGSIYLVLICWGANYVFSRLFDAPVNAESAFITALILALILTPPTGFNDFMTFIWAGIFAMASKYILTIGKKHIFNPAAMGVWIVGIGLGQYASWWVGDAWLTPFVVIGGLLLTRKIRRFDLVLTFLIVGFVGTILSAGVFGHSPLEKVATEVLTATPLFFLAFVMLTEPLTTPPTRGLRLIYGAIVGFLFTPQIHLAALYSTPEAALLIGNVFSYLVSPKEKLILQLKERLKLTATTEDLVFPLNGQMNYRAGQYMEWTMPHDHPDSRGNRRYFTLASSPTESTLRIGVKYSQNGSSYKKALQAMGGQDNIVAAQLSGDFTLPADQNQKLVFIAGGIGVTPYRSMVKFLVDKVEKRDIILFYAAKSSSELVYRDVFEAGRKIGLRPIYVVEKNDTGLMGAKVGLLDEKLLTAEVPDYKERDFYISGPHGMVEAFKSTLSSLGVHRVKEDFFPGYA